MKIWDYEMKLVTEDKDRWSEIKGSISENDLIELGELLNKYQEKSLWEGAKNDIPCLNKLDKKNGNPGSPIYLKLQGIINKDNEIVLRVKGDLLEVDMFLNKLDKLYNIKQWCYDI